MNNRDNVSIELGPWLGLWDRSGDGPPPNHLRTCDNAIFINECTVSRPGFSELIAKDGILRTIPFKLSTGPLVGRWLILLSAGGINYEVYDTGFSTVTPIYTFSTSSSVVDMTATVVYDRVFISIHDRTHGIFFADGIQVWDPTIMTVTRDAAGFAPGGTFTVAVSGTNGNIEPGQHVYAVAYETDTGHITKPGLYVSLTSPSGTKKRTDLTAIPTGPAGTVARWILMSKVVLNGDGNLQHPKIFLAKRIGDNTTTTQTGADALDLYDTQLIADGDYLKSIYEQIPMGIGLSMYSGRFAVANMDISMLIPGGPGGPVWTIPRAERSLVIYSTKNQVETFSQLDGFQQFPRSEGGGIKHISELNGIFYVRKTFMTFSTQDNGLPPTQWPINTVDVATGTEFMGVGTFPGTQSGSYRGIQVVADRSGLFIFDGSYQNRALSWKIESAWQRFDPTNFSQISVTVDPESNRIYVLKPQNGPIDTTEIFVADLSGGFDPDSVRWSRWTMLTRVVSLFVDYVNSLTPTLIIQIGESTTPGTDPNQGIHKLEALTDMQGYNLRPSEFLYPGQMLLEVANIQIHDTGGKGQLNAVRHRMCALGLQDNPDAIVRTQVRGNHNTGLSAQLADITVPSGTLDLDGLDNYFILAKSFVARRIFLTLTQEEDVFWAIAKMWLFAKEYSDEDPA